MQSFPRSVVPSFCRSLFPLFPPFVAQIFSNFFLPKSKNSFKNEFPTLFYRGRFPKNMCDFSKFFFPLLPPFVAQNFFENIFFVKIEKFLQKWIPHPFIQGACPQKTCAIFQKKKKKKAFFPRRSRPPPPKIFFLSPGEQKKIENFFLSKSKNASIF